MEIAYVYDGSFPGLLTAVFTAFERREDPYVIAREDGLQMVFGQSVTTVEADEALAARVERGLVKKAGQEVYDAVWTAFLSGDSDKATKIYRFIRLAMKVGASVLGHLSNDDALAIAEMNKHTGGEAHLLKGFVRFSLMENRVYYAKITPKNSVLPIIMPHFADRYNDQPFLIYDETNHLAGVYDLKDWYLVESQGISLPALAEGEREWRAMWRHFYETIGIKERTNLRNRMTHMPKRYWSNLTETLV